MFAVLDENDADSWLIFIQSSPPCNYKSWPNTCLGMDVNLKRLTSILAFDSVRTETSLLLCFSPADKR